MYGVNQTRTQGQKKTLTKETSTQGTNFQHCSDTEILCVNRIYFPTGVKKRDKIILEGGEDSTEEILVLNTFAAANHAFQQRKGKLNKRISKDIGRID